MSFELGTRVKTSSGNGKVVFCGQTKFAEGDWIGVILDAATGKNNGTIQGIQYFQCEPNFGVFVKASAVELEDSVKKSGLKAPTAAIRKDSSVMSRSTDSKASPGSSPGISPAASSEKMAGRQAGMGPRSMSKFDDPCEIQPSQMVNTVRLKMMDKSVEVDLPSNVLTQTTIKSQFLLHWDTVVSMSYKIDGRKKGCPMNEAGTAFLLPDCWPNIEFYVESERFLAPSGPAHPIVSPYTDAPSPPPPMSKSIDKWMFYASDSAGKSTVVCVHPRYFVTFRHGTHLRLQLGNSLKIFHATAEDQPNGKCGWNVTVVDINETLDFILLRSKENVVETAPRLVAGTESEMFLLAGFGYMATGSQKLAYLSGIVHSVQGYYFSLNDRPTAPLMGPFYLGTGQSSRGDSGGACWSSRGLIGINYGVTCMSDFGFTHLAIHEAATYSPKNIISPAVRIEDSLMAQLQIEQQNSPKSPPSNMKKLLQTEIEGLGSQTLFIDEERV